MSEPFQVSPHRPDFRDEDSSTFIELIAVEHTVRTTCDPRGPQVAANSFTQRFEFRVSAMSLYIVVYDEEGGWWQLDFGATNPDDLFCFEGTAVGIATVEDRHWDQVIVPVVVEVHDRPATPAELLVPRGPSPWDHIIEAGVDLDSGRLGITTAEISNTAIPIRVTPGYYRLRAYYGALDKLRGDLVEARPDDGRHRYNVKLWPHEGILKPRVLRRWRRPDPSSPAGPTPAGGDASERPGA